MLEKEDYVIDYADVNSLYSFVAQNSLFPIGIPEFVVNRLRLNTLKIENGEMFFENIPITGIARISILPPFSMFPFLVQRFENKVYSVCCNTCLEQKNQKMCTHSKKQRAIVGIYTIPEIVFAVEKCGYEILEIYEILAYK